MGMTEPVGEKYREENQRAQNHRGNPWLHPSPAPNAHNGTVLPAAREHKDGKCFLEPCTPFSPKAHPLLGHLLPQLVTQLHHTLQAGPTEPGLPWAVAVQAQQLPARVVAGPQNNHRHSYGLTQSHLHILFPCSGLLTLT